MSPANQKSNIAGLTSPASSVANAQREATASGLNIDVPRSLRMHPKLAAWVAAAVFVVIVGFALSRKPMYTAQSLTYVEPMTAKVLSDGTGGGFDPARYDSYLQQQMQTALRPDILGAALRKLPPGIWQQPGEKEASAVARLQKSLKVDRVTTSYQLAITLTGPDPDATAATVNAVTNSYLDQGRRDEHAISSQRLQLLTQERERIQADLQLDRTEQAGLSGALGVANPVGEASNPFDTQLTGVRTQLAAARAAHDVALAQLASVRGSKSAEAGLASAADDLLQNDTGLGSMKTTINQRKAILSSQMAGLTPSNPVYKQDQEEIADLDRSLEKVTTQMREKAEHRVEDRLALELQRTASIESLLNAQLAHQTSTATSAAPKLQRAAELASDIARLTARFATVDDAIRGLDLEANGPGLAHLSVAAAVPLAPDPSKRKLLLLLSLPLALFLGTGAAVLAHRRDPLVYTEGDLKSVLGFPPIGVLPSRDEVSRETVEEYVFRIAAGVETAYRVSNARSFVFTAASPTVILTGLIGVLQEKLEELGFSVHVLQAASLLQPGLGGGSGAPRKRELPGSGYIALLHDPNHEGFASANLAELKKNHDVLLIDAPPLLHSAATEYAVRCADATILVAGSAVTQRAELSQSAILLDKLNVAGVGAVLKDLMLKHADASFKAAIEVLEARWAAEATEAARTARSQRVAHHAARAAKDDTEAGAYARRFNDPLDADEAMRVEDDYGRDDYTPARSASAQQADDWDGEIVQPPYAGDERRADADNTLVNEPVHESALESAHEFKETPAGTHATPVPHSFVEESHELEAQEPAQDTQDEIARKIEEVEQAMKVRRKHAMHDRTAEPMPEVLVQQETVPEEPVHQEPLHQEPAHQESVAFAAAHEDTESVHEMAPPQKLAQEPTPHEEPAVASFAEPAEESAAVPSEAAFRPSLRVEEEMTDEERETETSERARLWLQRLLNPGSVPEAPVAPHQEVAALRAEEPETLLATAVDPEEETPADQAQALPDAVEPDAAENDVHEDDLQLSTPAPTLMETATDVVLLEEAHVEQEADRPQEEPVEILDLAAEADDMPPAPQMEQDIVAEPAHEAAADPQATAAIAEEAFSSHEPSPESSEAAHDDLTPEALDTFEQPPVPHQLYVGHVDADDEVHPLDETPFLQEAQPLLEEQHLANRNEAAEPVAVESIEAAEAVEVLQPTDEIEAEPVVAEAEAPSMQLEEPAPVTEHEAMAFAASVATQQVEEVRTARFAEPPVPASPHLSNGSARMDQFVQRPVAQQPSASFAGSQQPAFNASISGIRRAAAFREGRDPATSTRLPARHEGSIEPETGRLTRQWSMLSRFGLQPSSEDVPVSADERSGQ